MDGPEDSDWPQNYFNYFTEIEEHFQRARGTGLFLLSPLDWALIESWKNAGIPLPAVLKGIDEAFEKWRSRRKKHRSVNSLAYCAQAILEVAGRMPATTGHDKESPCPFAAEDVRMHLQSAADVLRDKDDARFHEIASSLESLAGEAAQHMDRLETLERRLTAIEDRMVAMARSVETDEVLFHIRQSLDSELKPYRSKMTADQLATLERRYLDSAILERARLPRLSLFYLR